MTSRTRNLSIIGLVLALLAASGYIIAQKRTVLGLDLRGGVELVYEGQPTPQVPNVTPESIDDAIETIRKRTDALGVSEPEIQRAGPDQISIGLPDVDNADRAREQVGTTAKLQFYDWEPNVLGDRPEAPFSGSKGLFRAVELGSESRPKAERTDIPPDAPDGLTPQRADRQNDTARDKYYLFGSDQQLIAGPDSSCQELLADFESVRGPPRSAKDVPKKSECRDALASIPVGRAKALDEGGVARRRTGPPAGSQVLKVPRGVVVIDANRAFDRPENVPTYVVLEDDSELSGGDIKNPEQNTDQNQQVVVTMDFTNEGRKRFASVTKRIAERGSQIFVPPSASQEEKDAAFQRFAITLDNEVVSLATINFRENPEGIDGRTGAQIEGLNEPGEARDLAENLRIGALAIDLKLISQTQVSATLGQQALDQGLLAGGVGLALTVLFLLAFYRVLGAVAAAALVIYAVLLFALVKLIPVTLTLPGIAGLILTLGIAADANIVIFERIKEEARAGRSIPAAITAGYAKALRTIIDANVVTIGVAFILFTLATAGVKGFAFTLGVGTLLSLFTAVLATSAILGAMARTRLIRAGFAIGAKKGAKAGWGFDFVGRSKWFFSISGLILVVGALAIAGLGIKFGIDFESGTRIKTPVQQTASVEDVRDTLAPLGYDDAKIQKVDEPDLGSNVFQIATPTLDPTEVNEVRQALDEDFGVRQADFTSSSIGPTFGAQIARTALIAIIASLLLISIYIALRFEAKFAVPVLIAVAHDILITSGVYALTGREVTTSTVAALLTILGYSLYDTIIVFDRIRENVPRMPRATFSQIVNRSMSEVLTRSLATSVSTLMPISALMLFGGETLRDFAFALLVGVASGAYSSIFIASPVLTLWKEREPIYVRRRKLALKEHGGVVPAFAPGTIAVEQAEAEAQAEPVPAGSAPRRRRRAAAAGGQRPSRAEQAAEPEPPAEQAAEPEPPAEPEPVPEPEPQPAPQPAAKAPAAVKARRPAKPQDKPSAKPSGGNADGGDGADGKSGSSTSTGGGASRPKPKSGAKRSRPRKKHGRR